MTEYHHDLGVGKVFFNRKVQIVEAKQGEDSVCMQGVEGWQKFSTGCLEPEQGKEGVHMGRAVAAA